MTPEIIADSYITRRIKFHFLDDGTDTPQMFTDFSEVLHTLEDRGQLVCIVKTSRGRYRVTLTPQPDQD